MKVKIKFYQIKPPSLKTLKLTELQNSTHIECIFNFINNLHGLKVLPD